MGLRGPVPKPTAAKKREGRYRPSEAPANEPPTEGRPVCPAWLRAEAKAEWKRLVPDLVKSGLAGKIDRNALARYCSLWVRWRQAEEMLARSGEIIPLKNSDGSLRYLQPSPYISIARGLADQLQKLEQSFGLNPSARSRISVEVEPSDELADFLKFTG